MTPLGDVYTFVVGAPADPAKVAGVLSRHVDGATITGALGLWKGQQEASVVVRIAGLSFERAMIIASVLRQAFAQDAVYVEFNGGEAWLETGEDAHTLAA